MKIRSKGKRGNKEQIHPALSGNGETQATTISQQQKTQSSQQFPTSLGKSNSPVAVSHPQPAQIVPISTSSDFLKGMEDPKLQLQNRNESTSPTHGRVVSVQVQDAQNPDQDRNASPKQLTELVTPDNQGACCPPSDKNHNLTAAYVVSSSGMFQYPCTGDDPESGQNRDYNTSNDPVASKAGLLSDVYYPAMYGNEKADMYRHSLFPASTGNYVYGKEGLYQQPYTFTDSICKNYNFPTPDAGREYSSPELTTYSSSSTYTPPLTTSNTSTAESPESAHWSPDSRVVNTGREVYMSLGAGGSNNGLLPPQINQESRNCFSGNSSSVHTSYYSDEQSLEGESMRDIEQDILQSDIQKHIYENFAQNLRTEFQPDETSFDHTENLSPEQDPCSRKSSTGSKKRRRRTQTPVQRKAANMRERKRMCHLNVAFNSLKDRLPNVRNRKKLSRIQTLRAAIFYISLLTECLQSS